MSDELPKGHTFFTDEIGLGINRLACECGQQLYPDCDISAASIVEEFLRHCAEMATI